MIEKMFENLSLLSHDEKKKLIRTLGEIFLLANKDKIIITDIERIIEMSKTTGFKSNEDQINIDKLNKSLDLFVDDFIKACPALMV